MILRAALLIALFFTCATGKGQQADKPYKCGFFPKDTAYFKKYYNNRVQYMGIQKGEKVASIGAQNGTFEMRMAIFIDSVSWTIQDIDSSYTNTAELEKVRRYYEGLLGRKISGDFAPVVGTETETNLPSGAYDRVLLLNVYHEITQPEEMVRDMYRVLKPGGRLVFLERMGNRRGRRRKDCNHVMPFQEDVVRDFGKAGFKLVAVHYDKKWRYKESILTFERP